MHDDFDSARYDAEFLKRDRDLFATYAMQGLLAACAGDGVPLMKPEVVAEKAYKYADAMLAERAKAK